MHYVIIKICYRKQGLVGKTEWEQAKVDELVNIQKDLYKEFGPFYYSFAGFKEPEKVSLIILENIYEFVFRKMNTIKVLQSLC